jgi:hypothetical protein
MRSRKFIGNIEEKKGILEKNEGAVVWANNPARLE